MRSRHHHGTIAAARDLRGPVRLHGLTRAAGLIRAATRPDQLNSLIHATFPCGGSGWGLHHCLRANPWRRPRHGPPVLERVCPGARRRLQRPSPRGAPPHPNSMQANAAAAHLTRVLTLAVLISYMRRTASVICRLFARVSTMKTRVLLSALGWGELWGVTQSMGAECCSTPCARAQNR